MLYRILADLVLIFHMLFIVFAVFGGLLILWRKWIMYVHIPAALWGVTVEVMHWICPLTFTENFLRHLAGDSGYAGGFVEHYLLPVIYPQGLTPKIQLILGLMVLLSNIVIYTVVIRKLRRKRANAA